MIRLSRYVFFIVLLLLQIQAMAQQRQWPTQAFRMQMVQAVENSTLTDSLFKEMQQLSKPNALELGYLGTLEALKAKHSWNPYNKLKYVSRANKTMRRAVALDPQLAELRFMRFSIQHYTPAFLGFSKELQEDRLAIVLHYQNATFAAMPPELIRSIAQFMIDSKRCVASEIELFKKFAQ